MLSSLFFVVTTVAFQGSPPASNEFAPNTTPAPPKPQISPELRGDIQMAYKNYREAIEVYKTGPQNSAVIANKIGIAYQQLQQLDLAKKSYERAIKLDRAYAEAVNNLGTVYYAEKSYRRAIAQYKKAILIKGETASVLSNLGTAYLARKNYEIAAATYQRAFELDPEVFERRNTVGVLLQDGNVEERAKQHYIIARMYAHAGKNDLALLYIRKAIEEGFKEREKFTKEPEFAGLRADPEFQKLMTMEQKVL